MKTTVLLTLESNGLVHKGELSSTGELKFLGSNTIIGSLASFCFAAVGYQNGQTADRIKLHYNDRLITTYGNVQATLEGSEKRTLSTIYEKVVQRYEEEEKIITAMKFHETDTDSQDASYEDDEYDECDDSDDEKIEELIERVKKFYLNKGDETKKRANAALLHFIADSIMRSQH